MAYWGGPKRRIRGMSLGWLIFTLFGQVLLGLGRGLAIWIPAVAIAAISFPVSQGCSNAIWQAKPSAPCLWGAPGHRSLCSLVRAALR